ncbi:MAG: sigma-E factor negative regulatory protein RseB [Paracoccaceae bacterium]
MLKKEMWRLLALCLVAATSQAEDAQQWLERMSHAHREMSYQGVVSYQVDGSLSSYKFTHRVVDGSEFEELRPLDSDDRGLVRHGHSIHCVHPAEQLLRSSSGQNGSLGQYYDVAIGEPGRVAGRDVITLNITPRDVFRLSYRIALDSMTAIPLKTETRDQSGQVLERFQFMMFELGAPQGGAVGGNAREISHSAVVSAKARVQMLAELPWQPAWIPEGFTLAQPSEAGQGENGASGALSYTDGMSMFSVFMESTDSFASAPEASSMRRGATVSFTYPIPGQNYVATVMGEVPLLTAEQVAKSVMVKP